MPPLAAFGSAEHVLAAGRAALLELVDPDTAQTLLRRDPRDEALLAATLRWLEAAPASDSGTGTVAAREPLRGPSNA